LTSDPLVESGGLAALTGVPLSQDAAFSILGFHFDSRQGITISGLRLRPHARLAWQHGWSGLTGVFRGKFASSPASFSVTGQHVARDQLRSDIGAGLKVGRVEIDVSYLGVLASGYGENGFKVGTGLPF